MKLSTATLKKSLKGFTLIELLVVIAILGILAGAVLVAVNPLEQLARGRDSGRKSAVTQLGRALQAYYTAQATYPTAGATWMEPLVTSQEIKTVPVNPAPAGYSNVCDTGVAGHVEDNEYCYFTSASGTPEAIVYALAESTSDKLRAGSAAGATGCTDTATERAWIIWSSTVGRSGLFCTTNTAFPTLTSVPL